MIKKCQAVRNMCLCLVCSVLFIFCCMGQQWMLEEDSPAEDIYSSVGNGHEIIAHSALPHEGVLHRFEGELPGNNSISSLGIGVSWMKKFWEERGAEKKIFSSYDDSLSTFLSEQEAICIPQYSEAIPWDADPRYMVEDSGCGTKMFRSVVRSGDSAGELLMKWLDSNELSQVVHDSGDVYSFDKVMPGHMFTVEYDTREEKAVRFSYEIDDERRLIIERENGVFSVRIDFFELETKIIRVSGVIRSSLFESMSEAGESAQLAVKLAEVFSHQINFVSDVQNGDSFELVVEKKYLENSFRRYGHIRAARFWCDGKLFEAFLYSDNKGNIHYFSADGTSLETEFLKAPLNFTKVTSGYTMKRRHPVFGRIRPHQGVDYAAPHGTPVKALGDGTVSFKGWKKGYGNTLVLKHGNGIETQYAHLSRFASSLHIGQKVKQGEIVAFVGATGTATGPHLDFRVIKDGRFIDPSSLSGTRVFALPVEKRKDFMDQVASLRALLDSNAAVAENEKTDF